MYETPNDHHPHPHPHPHPHHHHHHPHHHHHHPHPHPCHHDVHHIYRRIGQFSVRHLLIIWSLPSSSLSCFARLEGELLQEWRPCGRRGFGCKTCSEGQAISINKPCEVFFGTLMAIVNAGARQYVNYKMLKKAPRKNGCFATDCLQIPTKPIDSTVIINRIVGCHSMFFGPPKKNFPPSCGSHPVEPQIDGQHSDLA